MDAAQLAVESAQLALFVLVCGAILWELRRARHEANARGETGRELLEQQLDEARELLALDLTLEHEARLTRQAVEGRR